MAGEIFYVVIIVCLMFFTLSFFVVYLAIYQYRRKVIFKQQLLQTQIEIQSQTLKTISQEIHDNIGQVLSLAKLNLNTLQPGEETKLIDTKNLVSKAINDLRDLSRSLYGNKIAELGLEEAIDNELTILQNSGQFRTSLKVTGNSYKLEPQKEMVVFRIVQECLNNIIKHSNAREITAVVQYDTGLFSLSISDDGIGFNTEVLNAERPGIGLKSMQSRAALIGGQVAVTSAPQKGTTVTISITGTVL
jgi:signal transduction histidine kinase